MNAGLVPQLRQTYRKTADFFQRQIWEQRLDDLPERRARLYGAARIVDTIFRALVFGDTLHVRAAALTYFTVLSIVPLLAFAFALLKGFGAYEVLVRDSLRPYILGLLASNEALSMAFERILGFVEQTDVTSLGFLGLLTLLYAATRLLRNIEEALNQIWDVAAGRALLQQLRDYIAIIVITPLCLMAAAALTTASEALEPLASASHTRVYNLVAPLLEVLSPLVALFLGLLFLYKVMPHAHVRLLSATLGAALGGLLWYLVLIIHVRFQVGVARYNALYSSFGAIPIFLAWLHLSWLVVLVGAQVAATHQNHRGIAQRTRSADFDQAQREVICIAASLRVARSFMACTAAPSVCELSSELDVPESLVRQLLERLARAGLLAKVTSDAETSYTLARPADAIRLKDVLDAVRRAGPHGATHASASARTADALALWRELERQAEGSPENRTLHSILAEAAPEGERRSA